MDDAGASNIWSAPPMEAAVEVRTPTGPQAPVLYASPHSGRLYPNDMLQASSLNGPAIRRSEDALVDALVGDAASLGVGLVSARYARAYMDVNREPWELDPAMFEDELPAFARAKGPRVAAGLGAIARVVAEGQEIYDRKLSFAEARRRVEGVHLPYHAALSDGLAGLKARFARVALIDWHSMPSAATRPARGRRAADFVLGDRFGASCSPALTSLIERELRRLGYEVARNAPYAGGYTTELYGDPGRGVNAIQVEINRALYLDETTIEPTLGFAGLRADLARVSAAVVAGWTSG